MKKLTALSAAALLAASVAGGAMAEETIKPLESTTTTKSTQTSLPGLDSWFNGMSARPLYAFGAAVVTVVTVVAATSGT